MASLGKLSGKVYGGRQPIVGARIFVLAAAAAAPSTAVTTGGYGGNGIPPNGLNASTSLLGTTNTTQDTNSTSPTYNDNYVTTDAGGNFSVTGDYTCVQGTSVYLYATGGNPGAGTNAAAGLMALLGTCPANGSLASVTPAVEMNELSTVAAAYAFAGFATDPLHVGSSGTTFAVTGMQNAFANAAQLYQLDGNGAGGSGASALATTPGTGIKGGTGTVPQAELNTLANILAGCVDSTGPASPGCSGLFSDAMNGSIAPLDTAYAAINIAHNPGTHVADLYNLVVASGSPYIPTLNAAPANWTVSLAFAGENLQQTSAGGGQDPRSLGIDGSGNIWIADVNAGTTNQLLKFSPLGVPVNTVGYNLNAYYQTQLAIDASSSNIWLSSRFGGGVIKFNIAAATITNYAVASNTKIDDLEFDGSGTPWFIDNANNSLVQMNASTGALTQTITGNGLSAPQTMAIEAGTAGNIWVMNGQSAANQSIFTDAGAIFANDTANTQTYNENNAIDASGNVWVGGYSLNKLTSDGLSDTKYTGFGAIDGMAFDGSNTLWAADRGSVTIYRVSNTGVILNAATSGFAPLPTTTPDAIAVDGSGNVWYTSFNGPTLRELIGAAAPTVTPLSYAVKNSVIGVRP